MTSPSFVQRIREYNRNPRSRRWGTLAVLALFVLSAFIHYRDVDGDDLSSSYVGCRLMRTGNAAHLYSYDPIDFAAVGKDDAWQAQADFGGYDSFLHPYVQTPLWAYSLQPLCASSFETFKRRFTFASLLAFAACFWLIARFWAPVFLSPFTMAVAVLCLWLSQPFQYAMALMQTHVLFLLPVLAGLILAERRRPGWAGFLLALAAAVKITPAALVLYWALTRRWKAAASTIAWSLALVAITLLTTRAEVLPYLADLHRISRVMLTAFNNQSLAAWWMGRFYPAEITTFKILPLPAALRIGSTALMVALTLAGGLLDRRRQAAHPNLPPIGAMIALIGATLSAPIAWTHYFIILIAPLMILWSEGRKRRQTWLLAAVVLVLALNCRPLATNMGEGGDTRLTLIRSEFYAGTLALALLAALPWLGAKSFSLQPRQEHTTY